MSRCKAVHKSNVCLVKTANGINYHGDMGKNRKVVNNGCPIYYQDESWIHVLMYSSTEREKQTLVSSIQQVRFLVTEREDRDRVITAINKQFDNGQMS